MSAPPPDEVIYADGVYTIRPARGNGEGKEMWWSFMQSLGWNRGYDDFETYINASVTRRLLLLILVTSGQPVGCVEATINSNRTCWISLFIVDSAHRNRGLGRRLFAAAELEAERCGCRMIGLDAVMGLQTTYERKGYVHFPNNDARVMTFDLAANDDALRLSTDSHPTGDDVLLGIHDVPQHLLVQHEAYCTGFQRPCLWGSDNMLGRRDVTGHVLFSNAHHESSGAIKAWAVSRQCQYGFRVGPVYAQDAHSARLVLSAVMRSVCAAYPQSRSEAVVRSEKQSEASLACQVWAANPKAIDIFQSLGWRATGVYMNRMWKSGLAPSEQLEGAEAHGKVFAIFDGVIG